MTTDKDAERAWYRVNSRANQYFFSFVGYSTTTGSSSWIRRAMSFRHSSQDLSSLGVSGVECECLLQIRFRRILIPLRNVSLRQSHQRRHRLRIELEVQLKPRQRIVGLPRAERFSAQIEKHGLTEIIRTGVQIALPQLAILRHRRRLALPEHRLSEHVGQLRRVRHAAMTGRALNADHLRRWLVHGRR